MGNELAATKHGHTWRGHGTRIITLIIAVLALLPVAYVFNGFRTATGEALQVNAVQRAGVEYLRPLGTFLATLVDAQNAAVRGEPLPTDAVREAIEQVNRVDQASGDKLGVRQRWSQLRGEIESALGATVSGPAAVGVYAQAIGLTQALSTRIAGPSMIASIPVADAWYLISAVFISVPEAMAGSGEIATLAWSALASPGPSTGAAVSRIATVLDRISRTTQVIRIGPHSGTDQKGTSAATMGLLGPLDEFTAAADGLAQIASVPGFPGRQTLPDLDRALRRLRQAALGLDAAVLDTLNAMLDGNSAELDARHRNMLIAGVLILIMSVALLLRLWLKSDGSNRRHANPPSGPAGLPDGPQRDSRERTEPGRVSVGRSAHVLRVREAR